jgi:2-methylaconitate cis-trans-isomerase PrpF
MDIPAILARGGTSRGLVLSATDLAGIERERWPLVFARLLGSPDPGGRQVDGVGGGNATTSKVSVLSRSESHPGAVDYEFFQIVVETGAVDQVGTCGNMSSASAQAAVTLGLVPATDPLTRVRLHDVNTGRMVEVDVVTAGGKVVTDGDFVQDGVATPGSPIVERFLDPGGATTGLLLPTGALTDELADTGMHASLIDCFNPVAFVHASSIAGMAWDPATLERTTTMDDLERIRRWAAVRCGFAESEDDPASAPYYPFVGVYWDPAMGAPAAPPWRGTGPAILVLSGGRAHRAAPLGATIAAAALARLRGNEDDRIRIRHPSGGTEIGVISERGEIASASVTLTAREIMRGVVHVDPV